MSEKVKVAIIGSGNIGMDLLYKVKKSKNLEVGLVTNIVNSENLQKVAEMGIPVSTEGIKAIIDDPTCAKIVFDATTAKAHIEHAKILRELGMVAIDMTPASVGTQVAPAFNMEENLDKDNINLISCGGQAVIPIIRAIGSVTEVDYAEAINAPASISVGPGTRENVDEYTAHTGEAMVNVGGAKTSKAIVVINPADPPLPMHNTVFAVCNDLDEEKAEKITESILDVVKKVQSYVPGYVMTTPPQFDYEKKLVTAMVEITGAGDFLPKYAGNLDIITQAAIVIADRMAEEMLRKEK